MDVKITSLSKSNCMVIFSCRCQTCKQGYIYYGPPFNTGSFQTICHPVIVIQMNNSSLFSCQKKFCRLKIYSYFVVFPFESNNFDPEGNILFRVCPQGVLIPLNKEVCVWSSDVLSFGIFHATVLHTGQGKIGTVIARAGILCRPIYSSNRRNPLEFFPAPLFIVAKYYFKKLMLETR